LQQNQCFSHFATFVPFVLLSETAISTLFPQGDTAFVQQFMHCCLNCIDQTD